MSTQGLVTVVSGGRVVLKLVAGCNGSRAKEVATELAKGTIPPISLPNVYQMCIEKSFGCERCLVVYNSDIHICEGELTERYQETFHIPGFNPRWERGTAEYNVLVDIDLKEVSEFKTITETVVEAYTSLKQRAKEPRPPTPIEVWYLDPRGW